MARRSGGPEEALIWSEAPPFFEAPPLSEGRGGGSGAWAGCVAVAGRQVAASGSFLGARCGEEKARARADTKQLCSSLIFKKNHATALPVLVSRLAYVLTPRQSSDPMLHFISISTIHPVFRAGRSHFLFRARLNVPVPIQMPLKVWLFQWWYLQQR